MLTIGSLFSGIGGLELGLEWAGLGPVLWQVESDRSCRGILAEHWPDAHRFIDVRRVGAANLAPVDLLCGGFPCQDVSLAGRGAGLGGDSSGLWYEFERIIDETQPFVVVIENVSGLVRRGLDRVVAGLDGLGYSVEATRLRASDLGAPHFRERLFVVAYANGEGELRRGEGRRQQRRRRARDGGEDVAHADGNAERQQPKRKQRKPTQRGYAQPLYVGSARRRAAEPGVGGSADGLPDRLDWPGLPTEPPRAWEPPRSVTDCLAREARLRALGNAVVPPCAFVVGRRIAERVGLDHG